MFDLLRISHDKNKCYVQANKKRNKNITQHIFPVTFYLYLLAHTFIYLYLRRTLPFNLMTAMEDAMRKTIESYVVDSKRLELKEKIGSGD